MTHRKAVGIDLGTTFSAVAHIDAYGKPQIIPNAESERITPSVILFDGANVIVGTHAKNNSVAEPEKIVDFVKREMGKPKEQFHREFGGTIYSAEELSALIVKKLIVDAERYLKEPVTDAVITVPAYFNDAERTATITAGQLAGLNVLQIINEPTAAALAYGLDKLEQDQTVFVFDLGGGTFDVTIMRIENQKLNIIATNGDHRLGGKDWDDVLVNYVAEEFDHAHDVLWFGADFLRRQHRLPAEIAAGLRPLGHVVAPAQREQRPRQRCLHPRAAGERWSGGDVPLQPAARVDRDEPVFILKQSVP